jgi:hypothetical protein
MPFGHAAYACAGQDLATIPKLGGFGGRAVVLGPQIGFILPLSKDYRGYLNIKDKDLEIENRAKG